MVAGTSRDAYDLQQGFGQLVNAGATAFLGNISLTRKGSGWDRPKFDSQGQYLFFSADLLDDAAYIGCWAIQALAA